MLYYLLYELPWLRTQVSALNVVQYITVRTAAATITALAISLLLGPWFVRKLRGFQIGQIIRTDGPESHLAKSGTPTMGGLLILTATLVPTLLWANLSNPYVWIAALTTAAYGGIGFADDYLKIVRKSHHGLLPRYKLANQILVGVIVGLVLMWLQRRGLYYTRLVFPFFKRVIPELSWTYVPFTVVFLVWWSNSVNLTDGLDGLAISTTAISAATYTALAYIVGNRVLADYLYVLHLRPIAELTIFGGSLVGASLGFLWYNSYPADIFMGDVGSLALGAGLATMAMLIKQELLLFIVGGVFMLEGLSVVIQVAYFKMTGKRVFKMAPLHHHFEKSGWSEPKIISRFVILGILFALLSLASLKLR
ncbi:MAG TPA: phospho-N-acetylmuramoyl-pentapeptide-transferase [Vicinamibacterales bacterium]|nr:phospho-N-acetylmuramoyl-pentapeptide-transferase [Vicinamibacterales bacterium]